MKSIFTFLLYFPRISLKFPVPFSEVDMTNFGLGLTLNSNPLQLYYKVKVKKMLIVILCQLLIFVGVMRILSLKVNTPVSPPWKKGRGMMKGLEEWGSILQTHKALQREVFFSDEFLPSLNAHGRVCSSLIVNPRILKQISVLPSNETLS